METTLDTPYVFFEIKDNILFATYKKGLEINLEMAKQIVQARLKFMNGKKLPVIVFDGGVISITKEARDFLGSEGNKDLLAGAIIQTKPVSAAINNFFLFVSKPNIPARIFTKVDTALKWLSKFNK